MAYSDYYFGGDTEDYSIPDLAFNDPTPSQASADGPWWLDGFQGDGTNAGLGSGTMSGDGSWTGTGTGDSRPWWLDGFQGDGSTAGLGSGTMAPDGSWSGSAAGGDSGAGGSPSFLDKLWSGISGAGSSVGKGLGSLVPTTADGGTDWSRLLPALISGGAGLAAAIQGVEGSDTKNLDSLYTNLSGTSNDLMGRMKSSYWPVEDKAIAWASRDPTAEAERQAGDVNATYQQQLASNREAQLREMAAMGINPNSGSFAATRQQADTLGAAANAAGMNAARTAAKNQVFQDQLNVAKMGSYLPTAATQTADTAMRAATAKTNATASDSANRMAGLGMLAGSLGSLGNRVNVNTLNSTGTVKALPYTTGIEQTGV